MKKLHVSKKGGQLYANYLQLVVTGSVTGIFAGAVATLFNILAHEGERISQDAYAYVRANLWLLPLLLVVLVFGAILIGGISRFSSAARGCGIPQAEGAIRSVIHLKWYREMTTMIASTLLSIFMGLSIGAEGPSVFIGSCAGDGVASCLHRDEMIRKYQITGGACAGLAVASNAPLTGIVFAFEEAHKRFTPEVFICAFSSVIFGMLTRTAIYGLLHKEIENAFNSWVFFEMPWEYYGYVVLAGIICGILGVLFYKLCFAMRRRFRKISTKKAERAPFVRIAIAVLAGGIVSLLSIDAMGGGHSLIESLGTYGGTAEPTTALAFGLPLIWTLVLTLVLKSVITSINVAADIPCGIFIPMIAIGACIGGSLNVLFIDIGMDARYGDLMVMICMAAFFTTVVKAPLTAIIMICEFTGSFAPLLPVIIAVSIGYMIGEMARTDGIYEELLEAYEEENGIHERAKREVFILGVAIGALADKREVRDILWPAGARVQEIERGDELILPDGDTVIRGGDVLTIVCKTDQPEKIRNELSHILG